MKNLPAAYTSGDSIAALATPPGTGALAVIRTSGARSLEFLAPAFTGPRRLLSAAGGTMLHGFLKEPDADEKIDEVMLGVFRAPASYTGEDSVEIYCHGGPAGVRRVLALLAKLGFRPAAPGEFTFRAFLNGKMDLTRAEAVREIVAAETEKAHSLALRRLAGGVAQKINQAKNFLAELAAEIEIRLDYPEEDAPDAALPLALLDGAEEITGRLLAGYGEGRLYQEGAAVAIAGRPNAGKSSLFNFLLKEDRAIVSEEPGTTRDYIEARLSIEGIPVRLYDTAGLRGAAGSVEAEGVRRSRRILENAGLALYVIAAPEGASGEDEKNIRELGGRGLVVWSKCDAAPGGFDGLLPGRGAEALKTSALTGQGIPELLAAIGKKLLPLRTAADEALIDSERQRDLLAQCRDALQRFRSRLPRYPLDMVAEDLREALRALGEITGEVTTEDTLTLMFSRFCVGK
jgi:tRNA modification GTPase